MKITHLFIYLFNPYLRIYLLILGKEGGRKRPLIWEGKSGSVASHSAPTGDQNHNLLVNGIMLQPTEPPGQGIIAQIVKERNMNTFFKIILFRAHHNNDPAAYLASLSFLPLSYMLWLYWTSCHFPAMLHLLPFLFLYICVLFLHLSLAR